MTADPIMFTVCPKCTLTLAVTAADLRTGQGYVRCGRCLNVFNALLALSEEPAATADPKPGTEVGTALATTDESAEAVEVEAPAGVHVKPALDTPERAPLPTEISSDGAIESESSLADGTGTFETIVLEGDAITQTEEFVPEESVDSEIAALAQRLHVAAQDTSEAPPSTDGIEVSDIDPDDVPVDAAEIIPMARRPHAGRWAAGCVLMLLLLTIQAVNHWRDALASTPSLSAPMSHLYAHLGVPLDPHWNLSAYDVRQQGAVTDPSDSHVIRVRLSLANRAAQPQPVPLLRLTLLDRYGKSIAMRDLTPSEYWPQGHAPRSFLAHDERIDSEVAVHDPGADSASFELDVCLKNNAGVVRCAGDTVNAPAPVP
ncbi:MAG TPA: zinc-ribbon and DUF3426 domain-containing protein [Steroidobacteraceae bacterium]|jgi:predicted Zn finger-like uncharacterized protein